MLFCWHECMRTKRKRNIPFDCMCKSEMLSISFVASTILEIKKDGSTLKTRIIETQQYFPLINQFEIFRFIIVFCDPFFEIYIPKLRHVIFKSVSKAVRTSTGYNGMLESLDSVTLKFRVSPSPCLCIQYAAYLRRILCKNDTTVLSYMLHPRIERQVVLSSPLSSRWPSIGPYSIFCRKYCRQSNRRCISALYM